jgi:hypothetical protein
MTSCHDMKKGQIYICEDCGIELEVIKECKDSDKPGTSCGCQSNDEEAGFKCCGKELKLKK